jgi:hypothetical protein
MINVVYGNCGSGMTSLALKTFDRKGYMKKYSEEYNKTEIGVLKKLYFHTNSKYTREKGKFKLHFSLEEFTYWAYSQDYFLKYMQYVKSKYNPNYKPSVDRINDYEPYVFENMQIIQAQLNHFKGINSLKNRIENKKFFKKYSGDNRKFRKIKNKILEVD